MAFQVKKTAMVLADISGYTQFTRYHAMAVMHAEQIITDLLETIVESAEFPLSVGKFEGDAVFFYAVSQGDDRALARDVIKQARQFFDAFAIKAQQILTHPVCFCEACRDAGQLKLKMVMHFGDATFKQIKGFDEIGGADVRYAHQLIKNSIPSREYALMTDEFHLLAGDFPDAQGETRLESVEGIGRVPVQVFYPAGRESFAAPLAPIHVPLMRRLRQYLRVNRYAIMRWLRMRPGRIFSHLPR
jgi:hypothetical protein